MTILVTNNAAGTLASGISDTDLSLTLSTGQGDEFPDLSTPGDFFYATLVNAGGTTREIVKVTAKTGDALTIVRGADGPEDPIVTTSYAFATGSRVELRFCKAMWDALPQLAVDNTFAGDNIFSGDNDFTGTNAFSNTTAFAGLTASGTAALTVLTVSGTATFNGSLLKGSNKVDNFAAATAQLFRQTAAPTGWTKTTTYNDAALRVVSGTISQQATAGKEFSTLFAARTIAQANLPAHTHTFSATTSENGAHTHMVGQAALSGSGSGTVMRGNLDEKETTEDGAHTHTISGTTGNGPGSGTALDFAVNYVDVIIATKDA